MENDTVVDAGGKTVWHGLPESVTRYLNYRLKQNDATVRMCTVHVGKTNQIHSVMGYLNREKSEAIQQMLTDMIDRQDTRPYKGVARRLYIERVTKKIIDLM